MDAPQAPSGPHAAPQKRLLIVKLGAIGDVVMAIPAAAALHASGYAVDWIAGEAAAAVLQLYPWIHVIVVDEARLLRGSKAGRLRAVLGLWAVLRSRAAGEAYDLCATLYYDRRYKLLTLPVPSRRRLSLSPELRATRLLPGRHHTDEYARILSGVPDGERPKHLAPVPAPNLPQNPWPRPTEGARVALVPAGARNLLRDDALRRWPIDSYVALAKVLLLAGHEVVLLGGPEDVWAGDAFSALAGDFGPERFVNLLGKLTLPETLALMDATDVTVTHDTGPLHLAGITGTAIIGLFGPTDPHGRLPQRGNCVALWGGEAFGCRPCYDGRDYALCAHNGCIREITPEMVVAVTNTLLGTRRKGCALPPHVLSAAQIGGPALTALSSLSPAPFNAEGGGA